MTHTVMFLPVAPTCHAKSAWTKLTPYGISWPSNWRSLPKSARSSSSSRRSILSAVGLMMCGNRLASPVVVLTWGCSCNSLSFSSVAVTTTAFASLKSYITERPSPSCCLTACRHLSWWSSLQWIQTRVWFSFIFTLLVSCLCLIAVFAFIWARKARVVISSLFAKVLSRSILWECGISRAISFLEWHQVRFDT
jgi:hypothetical protein